MWLLAYMRCWRAAAHGMAAINVACRRRRWLLSTVACVMRMSVLCYAPKAEIVVAGRSIDILAVNVEAR